MIKIDQRDEFVNEYIPNLKVSVPILSFYYVISRSPLSEHFVQIIYKFLWPFVRGEMSTFLMLRIKYFVT